MTNYFSKIALVIIRENKTETKICDSETSNLAAILKTESRHCYNHLAVIIARENEVLAKQRAPFSIITSAILLKTNIQIEPWKTVHQLTFKVTLDANGANYNIVMKYNFLYK